MYSFFRQMLKKDHLFILYLSLCCLIYQGVSGGSDEVSEVSEKEGDSVRLESGVKTNQQNRIRWYFKNVRIAQIKGDFKICTDVQCNEGTERFRDRLKLDHQTGSLTITNTRTTDSGDYHLQIISGNNSNSEKTYRVNVQALTTDYSDYYEDNELGAPCNNGSTKAFSEVFLPTLYSIVFILGFIGNGLVMWVLIINRQKSNMTDVCLFNLALSDLLFLVSLPFWAHSAMDEWNFGKFMCHTITGLFMIGLYSRVFFMVLMTVDRYVVIVHAHSLLSRNRSAKIGFVLAGLVWILSLFASLPNIIFAKEKISSKTLCGFDFHEGSVWMSFLTMILSLIFPLIIMGFCYFHIIFALPIKKSLKRHAVIRLILAVVAVYFIFWTPYNVVLFLTLLQTKDHLWHTNLSLAMQWSETIALSHCCLNPIIYAFAGQKFRKAVLKVLSPSFLKKCTTSSQHFSESTKSTEYSSAQIT